MPTGYTARLMEKGQDFRSFVLTCARAMGACIMQRDDPMDQPPAKQEPSDYNTKALKAALEELARLRGMDSDAQYAFASALKVAEVNRCAEYLQKAKDENRRLDEMMFQVVAWVPPTPDHAGLKAFMVEQITISRNGLTYSEKSLREATEKPFRDFYVRALEQAERSIEYHRKELAKDNARTDARNEWIDQLYQSLPPSGASGERKA